MDIRQITDRYAVSPQIDAADLPAIKAAGFDRVICNRPDMEVPPSHQAEAIRAAADAAGIALTILPITRETLTPENAQAHAAALSEGKVLAYCASGTRSTMIWAMGRAAQGDAATDIIQNAADAGYDLSAMAPFLQSLGAQ